MESIHYETVALQTFRAVLRTWSLHKYVYISKLEPSYHNFRLPPIHRQKPAYWSSISTQHSIETEKQKTNPE